MEQMRELLRLGKKKWDWKRTIKIVMLLAFLVGVVVANVIGREQMAGAGVLNDYFIEKYKYAGINKENLFCYILEERMPMIIVLLLLSFSSFGAVIGVLNLGWVGFSVGFMLAAAMAKYGGRGILLVVGGMFPQYIIYILVYMGYCGLAFFMGKGMHQAASMNSLCKEQIRTYGMALIIGIALMLLFVTGIFLESYINPILLKKIVKFF